MICTVTFPCRYHGYIAQAESDGGDVEDSSGAQSFSTPNAKPTPSYSAPACAPRARQGCLCRLSPHDTQLNDHCISSLLLYGVSVPETLARSTHRGAVGQRPQRAALGAGRGSRAAHHLLPPRDATERCRSVVTLSIAAD